MSTTRTAARAGRPSGRVISDRTLNRLIVVLIGVLAIGVPTIAITYYLDRHVDSGPSLSQRAVSAAQEAVRANPNLLSARLTLGLAYADANRDQDAVDQYAVVLGAEPNNRIALLGRGDANRQIGNLDAAAADYQALVDLAKDAEMARVDAQLEAAYYGLGAIAYEQQRPADAAESLANALQISPTDADALDLMGRALIDLGDLPGAVEALTNAVTLVPSGWCDPYSHLNQAYTAQSDADGAAYASGMVALCEGRDADAEGLLAPLTNGSHSRDALIGLALVAEDQGDTEAAVGFYQQVYAQNPDDFAAVNGLNRLGATGDAAATDGAQ